MAECEYFISPSKKQMIESISIIVAIVVAVTVTLTLLRHHREEN